ncbi:glucosidase 2 subunit beta-like isoform X2 [Hoplias malabaricus]|uniref:glucosidase 2 subunit beta-like isoform X2 n=1 Tax=Hoplias malabaricus TaxID=27720 RepID=UPI003461B87C
MELQFQMVLAVLFFTESFSETRRIRGVSMSYRRFYRERKYFLCLDGSRLIPFVQVNDDYCDCADGSDEPGTAACPNGRFYCVNLGFRPHYVPSSRVNDGICDCCDGTDEFSSRIQCPNKCRMLGQKESWELEERMKAVKEGLIQKKQLIEEGVVVWKEKQAQLQQLQKMSEDLRMKVEEYRGMKLKAETEKEHLEIAVKSEDGFGEENKLHGGAPPGGTSKVNEGGSSVIHNKEPEEKTQIQQGQDPIKTPPHEDLDKLPPVIREAQSDDVLYHSWCIVGNRTVDRAVDELQKVEEAYDTVQMEIRELKEKLEIDYGAEREFVFLLSRCVQMSVSEYMYTLCPFSQVTQKNSEGSEVILGKWSGWIGPPDAPYTQMKFDEGDACWQGPKRSTVVSVVCGTETDLRSVKEPSRCLYSMELHTPAACRLNTLQRSIHNEL